MSKQAVRLGVTLKTDEWETLRKLDDFDAARPFVFAVEGGHPSVWLYYVLEDESAMKGILDLSGNLPCKSGGELRDWAEASNAYFRAAVRVARAEFEVHMSGEASRSVADEELAAALSEQRAALRAFTDAVASDAQQDVKHAEFERENSERLRFLKPRVT